MCTVTYYPYSNGYYLLSNRDEKLTRKKAILPAQYTINDTSVIFPKDPIAGGTWIALKENGDALCLLNGAFTNFIDTGNYSVSRGAIVKEIAGWYDMIAAFQAIYLEDTAPFTLIAVNNSKLWECRWDGKKKYYKKIKEDIPHIWSSATLYDEKQKSQREEWFSAWVAQNPCPGIYSLFNFHKSAGVGNPAIDLIMNREDKLSTVSITGIIANSSECLMQYLDLKNNDSTTISFADRKEYI